LHHLHHAVTAEEAELRLGEFEVKWETQYPPHRSVLAQELKWLIPFFNYLPEICEVIYTTNAIE
jgi:Transposase and inactivated derivatives